MAGLLRLSARISGPALSTQFAGSPSGQTVPRRTVTGESIRRRRLNGLPPHRCAGAQGLRNRFQARLVECGGSIHDAPPQLEACVWARGHRLGSRLLRLLRHDRWAGSVLRPNASIPVDRIHEWRGFVPHQPLHFRPGDHERPQIDKGSSIPRDEHKALGSGRDNRRKFRIDAVDIPVSGDDDLTIGGCLRYPFPVWHRLRVGGWIAPDVVGDFDPDGVKSVPEFLS